MKTVFITIFFLFATAGSSFSQSKVNHARSKAVVQIKDMLTMLQGGWSSLDDKKTFFQKEGDTQFYIYRKDILDTAKINFYDEC